jgi:hypothetical protein
VSNQIGKRIALAIMLCAGLGTGCATDIGTGEGVVKDLLSDYPITVGKLIRADIEPSRRLRIYIQLCENVDGVLLCEDHNQRMLAVIQSGEKKLLERLATQYLAKAGQMPIYVYGPHCEGLEEMILIPRCQTAVALGVYDPALKDYIVYSTLHGDGLLNSAGFANFIEVTGKATSLARSVAKVVP